MPQGSNIEIERPKVKVDAKVWACFLRVPFFYGDSPERVNRNVHGKWADLATLICVGFSFE